MFHLAEAVCAPGTAVLPEKMELESVHQRENIHFRIIGNPLEYDFWYSEDGKYYEKLGCGSTAGLATEGTMYMSFTGTYIGMFSENAEGHFRNFSVKINKN